MSGSHRAESAEERRPEKRGAAAHSYHASAGRKAEALFVSLFLELEFSTIAWTVLSACARTR